MNNSYTYLFESIRTKCEKEGWFGPDYLNPHPYEDVEYDSIFDQRTINAIPPDDPRRFHFAFPPATEDWKLPWMFEEWLWRWVRDEELIPR
jgi:hypothetical protein